MSYISTRHIAHTLQPGECVNQIGGTKFALCVLVQVIHTASVPALAYIAAGKLLKKYLLVPKSGGWLAAVLVENQKLMYVYTATASMQRQGKQQVSATEHIHSLHSTILHHTLKWQARLSVCALSCRRTRLLATLFARHVCCACTAATCYLFEESSVGCFVRSMLFYTPVLPAVTSIHFSIRYFL